MRKELGQVQKDVTPAAIDASAALLTNTIEHSSRGWGGALSDRNNETALKQLALVNRKSASVALQQSATADSKQTLAAQMETIAARSVTRGYTVDACESLNRVPHLIVCQPKQDDVAKVSLEGSKVHLSMLTFREVMRKRQIA